MKRAVGVGLALSIIVGPVSAPALAGKKESAQRKFFLRRADCGGDDRLRLSIKDGSDVPCTDMQAGLANDVAQQTGVSDTWQSYPAANGVPFVLNANEPITGEITLYGADCIAEPACLPQAGLSAGNATLRLAVVAESIGGKERTIGEFTESFLITPDEPTYTASFKVWPDEFFTGDRFVDMRLDIQVGGVSYGPGGISYDDPPSFITLPTLKR